MGRPRLALAASLLTLALLALPAGPLHAAPLPAGRSARASLDGDYPGTLVALLDGARREVIGSHYSFNADTPAGRRVARALRAAAARGVRVRLMLEHGAGGTGERNDETRAYLRRGGVEAIPDGPERVSHAKWFCVDGEWILAGSTNLSDASMTKNREANLLVRSPALGGFLERHFQALVREPERPRDAESPPDGGVALLADTAYYRHALALIDGATAEVELATYLVGLEPEHRRLERLERLDAAGDAPTGEALLAALETPSRPSPVLALVGALARARARGVNVRVTLEASSIAFNRHIDRINGNSARLLRRLGVARVRFEEKRRISHAKILLVDGRAALLGSTNWYDKDLAESHQLNFLVRDPALVAELSAYVKTGYPEGEAEP